MRNPLVNAYRRTGADIPFGNPLPSHGTEMEGWFWRVSDEASGRVLIALCSVNRHPDGDWSTTAVGVHPGGVVRSAALSGARAEDAPFRVTAGDHAGTFTVGADRVRFELGDLTLSMEFADRVLWPKAFGGGGMFSAIPCLNQYWHPYYLGGRASGTVAYAGDSWTFENAKLYAERNWGAGFPLRWWWGQAHDFGDADVCVAFSGGLLSLGPIARDVNGVVIRVGTKVIRMTPPLLVRSRVGDNQWSIRGRSPRYEIELEGDGRHLPPHVLPVPLPGERRNIDTDFEHLGGRLHCIVRESGRVLFEGTSELAALEVGSRPA
ncbi:MAG: tocopherol cyclase family protein [Actinomycetota bacterium]|nr:tocopherol cyclase family protein [Actinomycetota bacterium]MDA2949565.1 tocopherol cyclase family protein [Actinomycetota bacterium]